MCSPTNRKREKRMKVGDCIRTDITAMITHEVIITVEMTETENNPLF